MRLPSHHSAILLLSLYWAQGLPVGFMTHALPVILRSEGVSLKQIGGAGLLMLPWVLKVLWAPLLDRSTHYRNWLIPLQILLFSTLLIMAFYPIQQLQHMHYLLVFFALLLLLNLLSATQDIATDGLAVNLLSAQQLTWGNSIQVIGSRLGFIVGGGGMLWAVGTQGWQWAFIALALLIALNSLPVMLFKLPAKPKVTSHVQSAWWQTLWQSWQYFYAQPERRAWLWVLLSFKVSDGLTGVVLKTLLVDAGLTLPQIAGGISLLGAFTAVLAALLMLVLLKYCSRSALLWVLLSLKLSILLGYAVLAQRLQLHMWFEPDVWYIINAFEEAVGAMLLVLMLSWVMHYSRAATAASDFSLQVAIMASVAGLLYSVGGWLADSINIVQFLSLCSVLAMLSYWPIYRWLSKTAIAR